MQDILYEMFLRNFIPSTKYFEATGFWHDYTHCFVSGERAAAFFTLVGEAHV